MANEEHLKMIRQGVKTWNEWRAKYQKVTPDLSGADLSEIDLNSANLTGASSSMPI